MDTYFNSFSASKWLKYTMINDVRVRLYIKGKVRITMACKMRTMRGVIEKCVDETYFDSAVDGEFYDGEFVSDDRGIYYVNILSLSNDTEVLGGCYYTTADKSRDVNLAIVICTYKREKYVYNNIRLLEKMFMLNEQSDIGSHLYINISDNAKTLDKNVFASDHVRVFENKNAGGAGGFTRGIMESKKMQETYGLTHVLLMDDDIIIQPESIYRTFQLLTLLKEEYLDTFIGGAMLRMDLQWFQTEAGATWNAGRIESHKSGLDLRKVEDCLYNEVEEKSDFNAWWYCTFPIDIIRDDNLPMPIFIRGDDVEFGLRNMKHLILMNGICVWHEPFENKFSSSMYYYIFRNRLIDNAVREITYTKKEFLSEFKNWYFREIFTLRYKNARLLIDGVRDFLKGPKWLMEQDGEELNRQVIERGYNFVDVSNLSLNFDYHQFDRMLAYVEDKKSQRKRMLTLNGMFGKHIKAVCIPVQEPHIAYLYQAYGAVNYDPVSGKAFETFFDKEEQLALLKDFYQLKREVDRHYDLAVEEYRVAKTMLTSVEFWNKYLDLD